jgi:VIT1/CCC1 family predicted Fe2+/Mn2+ transporter
MGVREGAEAAVRDVNDRRGERHHRNVQGGTARAAVFGVSDGLLTNVSLILGMAGASADASVVRLAGLAGLVAGAFSMAAGEFVSMSAQAELMQRELEVEKQALERDPEGEHEELIDLYKGRGIEGSTAEAMAVQVMRDPRLALEVHAREEMGIDPDQLGSPIAAAASSFIAFSAGALVPLLPWFVASGAVAVAVAIMLSIGAAIALGGTIGVMTDRPWWASAVRQLLVGAVAGAVTYAVGRVLGVQAA